MRWPGGNQTDFARTIIRPSIAPYGQSQAIEDFMSAYRLSRLTDLPGG
jgi:hypothetical protein